MALLKKENNDSLVEPKQDYKSIFDGASFELFCSFRTLEDFVGWEWISKLHQISANYDLKLFNCIARISKAELKEGQELGIPLTKDYFNAEFLEKKIPKDTDKILLCGTPAMHKGTYDVLLKLGFDHDKVHFV